MTRFSAPSPNGDSRKMIEQRARDATRPVAPEKKGSWPFTANKEIFAANRHEARATADSSAEKNPN